MDEINTTQQCTLKYVCTLFAHVKETTGFITQIIQKVKEIGSHKQAAMLAAMVETSVSVLEAAKNASPETPQTDLHSLKELCLWRRSHMTFSKE